MGVLSRNQEEKLIRQATAGDRAAAERLVRAHQAGLYGFILRLSGRPEVAEDVTQEAFIRVLKHLDRFDPRFRFSTWLFTIARRVYFNAAAKKCPRLDGGGLLDQQSDATSRESRFEREDSAAATRASLEMALAQLPCEQREIVMLFHQCDWPLWLIAEQLQMPIGTVKSHLHRARLRLRDLMFSRDPAGEPKVASLGDSNAAAHKSIGRVVQRRAWSDTSPSGGTSRGVRRVLQGLTRKGPRS